MNTKLIRYFMLIMFFGCLFSQEQTSSAQDKRPSFIFPNNKLYGRAFSVNGVWSRGADRSEGKTAQEVQTPTRTYYVDVDIPQPKDKMLAYGASLDLTSLPGTFYEHIRDNLPGKTVSVRIFVPKGAISASKVIPNRVSFGAKSVKGDEWVEYCGKEGWVSVVKEGFYDLSFTVPDKPFATSSGKVFYPGDIRMFFISLYFTEGTKYNSQVIFSVSDLEIEDIDMSDRELLWALTKEGYTAPDSVLASFPPGSTYLESIGKEVVLSFSPGKNPKTGLNKGTARSNEVFFLSVPVVIPKELYGQEGDLELAISRADGLLGSTKKTFSKSDPNGRIFLTIALGNLKDPVLVGRELDLKLNIKSREEHTPDMMPLVIEPVKISQGSLIPFDEKWGLRDVQSTQETYKLPVSPGDKTGGANAVTCDALGPDQFQIIVTVPLEGGIDWASPFYRTELIRSFDEPVDMTGEHIQVLMTPLTDTTDIWQTPYRARVGLLDTNDSIMFGTNVSLSEGMPQLAYLDVSTINPMPKGFVQPDFDPKNVKALLIDFESSPAPVEMNNIRVSLSDLSISTPEYREATPLQKIDFSIFKRDPEAWQITKMIKNSKKIILGINYPFPTVKVSEDLLAVPQIYPTVGKKLTDPGHFGFSGQITRAQTLEDFKKFANDNINIVRVFTMGDLSGVFAWDYNNWSVTGFRPGNEELFKKMSTMGIREMTEFLNKNEDLLFPGTTGTLPGLNEYTLRDFTVLLDILEQVEKETGKKVTVIISLFDFLLGDGIYRQGPYLKYFVGEYPQVVTDPLVRVKIQAITWELMKTLKQDPRFVKYVTMVELINEPANACVLSTKEYFNDLVNFAGTGLYLLKDALGPSMPVGIGFRSWPRDLKFWSGISDGIDILTVHYWESLESYDINTPGLWPLDMPVKELWDLFGTKADGRIVGMTEISLPPGFEGYLEQTQKAGYDLCLVWSYSGHDGFKAKDLFGEISKYQAANSKK